MAKQWRLWFLVAPTEQLRFEFEAAEKEDAQKDSRRYRRQCLRHGWRYAIPSSAVLIADSIPAFALSTPEPGGYQSRGQPDRLLAIGYRLFPRHILLRKPSVDLSPDPQLVHILQLQRQ